MSRYKYTTLEENNRLLDLCEEGIYRKTWHVGCTESLAVSLHNDDKLWWYCHKCGMSGSRVKSRKNAREIQDVQGELQNIRNNTSDYLKGNTSPDIYLNVPTDKRDWLYSNGFTDKDIESLGSYLCYTPDLNRIVFNYDNFLQMR